MSTASQIIVALVGGLAVVAVLALRSGGRDPLAYIAAYFVFFGLGPAVNHLLGNPIYTGIAVRQLGGAALGILWALLAMLVVGLAIPVRRQPFSTTALESPRRSYPAVPALLGLLALYPLAAVALAGPAAFVGTKTDRISVAGGLHYQYLLLELLACSLYVLAVRTPAGRPLYWTNMAMYVGYCLLTAERDFLFVLFALLLYRQLFRRAMSVRLVLAGVAAVALATGLAAWRAGEAATSGLVLNQGSVMFTDTFVRVYVPTVFPFQHGQTYVDAVMSLLPGWGHGPDLAGWLVDQYVPGSSGGYGFSLTAEAYLNFGTIGIPFVFALLTLVQRLLVNRVDRGQFPAYLSLLFTIGWMYGFRGESANLVNLLVYGAVLFGAVTVLYLRHTETTTWVSRGRSAIAWRS